MAYSANKITVHLPDTGRGEQPHEAFANLLDDEASFDLFQKKWGRLTGNPMFNQHGFALGFRDELRKAWRGDKAALQTIGNRLNEYVRSSLEFNKGKIDLLPEGILGTLLLLFLRDHSDGKAAICANPDCASPHFIRKRSTQKYCEAGPCTEHAQREYARDWWRRNRATQKNRRKS